MKKIMKKTFIIIVAIFALYSCDKECDDVYNEEFTEVLSPSPSLKSIVGRTTVTGTYYWKLVFDYDNTTNTAPFAYTRTIEETKTFQTKTFVSEKFKLTSGYKLDAKSSVSLKFLSASASGSLDYSYHSELAKELEQTYESTASSKVTEKHEYTWNIGAGSKSSVYQLMFTSPYASYSTPTYSSFPKPAEYVYIDCELNEEILGLEDMLDNVLLTTIPKSDNRGEWTTIRSNIVRYSAHDDHTRLYQLLSTLKTITPRHDNKGEWAAIRATCNEILSDWNTVNRNSLYRQLLARFRDTNPLHDNKGEWAKIRAKATSIYNSTIQVW